MSDAPRLKPMTSTEILDGAFRLYRNNFATFLGILAIAYVPVIVIVMLISSFVLARLADRPVEESPENLDPAAMAVLVIGIGSAVLYGLVAMPLATGALTRAVGARYLSEPISIGQAYGHIFKMFFRYLWTTLLAGLVIGLTMIGGMLPGLAVMTLAHPVLGGALAFFGFLAGAAFGLLFWVWFFATAPICVLEGISGPRAMGRSRELVRGYGGRVFGFLLLSVLLSGVVSFPVNMAAELISKFFIPGIVLQNLFSQGVQQIFNMLVTPFFSIILILLYYDLRIRKEAFDLEILAKNLGKAAPAKP